MIPNYDSEVSHTFKRSNGFIKYIPLTVEEEKNKVEYNLDYHDEVGSGFLRDVQMWLRKHKLYGDNAPESKKLSADLFERMLDCADKYAGEHKSEPTVVGADGHSHIGHSGDPLSAEAAVQSRGLARGVQARSRLLEAQAKGAGEASAASLLAPHQRERHEPKPGVSSSREGGFPREW